jgi:hypothetical protein
MFNTSSLFAAMEKRKIISEARFHLRLFQVLHEKALKIHVVEELEDCFQHGITASIPFLSYSAATFEEGDCEFSTADLREMVSPHSLRYPSGGKVKHLAYSLCTTLDELVDSGELHQDGRTLLQRSSIGTGGIPARKLFLREYGAMAMLNHCLGEGLEVIPTYTDDKVFECGDQRIILQTVDWRIVFTGKKKKPWSIPQCIPSDSVIWHALDEILTSGASTHWSKWTYPYWKNLDIDDDTLAWYEKGNEGDEEGY